MSSQDREATIIEELQWLIEDSLLFNRQEKLSLLNRLSSLSLAQQIQLRAILFRELSLRDSLKRRAFG